MFSAFFIARARFAMVISLVIIIAGIIAIRVLPVAQFPDIVPPQVSVQAFYPGASAEILAETVAAPIEAEVVEAIRRQNLQAAAGRLGAPPDNATRAFTYTLQAKGRLTSPEEFERILVRTNPDGSVIRLADVARLELGAQTYDADAWIDGVPTAALGIYLSPGANALETADRVYATLERLAERFPDDLE